MAERIAVNGYIPHDGQVNIKCPKCGYGRFRTFAQSIPANWTEWTFEYACGKCGKIIGITLVNDKKPIQGAER